MAVQRFSMTIDSDVRDVRDARAFASQAGSHLVPSLDLSVLRLLVSELVTNAVLLDAGPITIALRPLGVGLLRVEVRDDGWGQPEVAQERPLQAGRGLRVVDRLATEWGVDQFLPGKIVWFTLAAPNPAAS